MRVDELRRIAGTDIIRHTSCPPGMNESKGSTKIPRAASAPESVSALSKKNANRGD
jgi:hypothetical protein